MKQLLFYTFIMTISLYAIYSCGDGEDSCTELTWYEDADGDGLGNSDVSINTCEQLSGYVSDNSCRY